MRVISVSSLAIAYSINYTLIHQRPIFLKIRAGIPVLPLGDGTGLTRSGAWLQTQPLMKARVIHYRS
jgi:hypothetical protein